MGDERTINGETNGEPIAGPEASGESVEALRAEVARLTQETDRNRQQFLRAAADLENYRKHAARQREEAVASTRRALLAVILGVADTLERALAHAGGAGAEAAAIADGIRLAHRQVSEVLSRMGVRPMEALGREFDPRFHDAVEAVAAGGCASAGTVAAEIQRGYMLGEEVLRPARVRVAQ
ncbi:MAG: nucleotide exchange factor GrpE [bacterium]|nr:nucleotide exchange factor GrpE [bacterium]